MLGHKVIQRLASRFTVSGAARHRDAAMIELERLTSSTISGGLDAEDFSSVERLVEADRPDVVVNCVGIIKQRAAAKDAIQSIRVNSLFPHELGAFCAERNARLVHLSTDCVFSGDKGHYEESDRPDPVDVYGRSKLLGEVAAPNALTIRTSMIGREIRGRQSLLEWFLRQPEGSTLKGFRHAIFSGLTTIALADEIGRVIERHPELSGVYQVSADPIDKYELLQLFKRSFGRKVEIVPDENFHCDRSLVSKRYRADVGYSPRPWPEMVDEMATDPTPYDRLQALSAA